MHRLCIDVPKTVVEGVTDGVAVVTRSYSVHNLYLPLQERSGTSANHNSQKVIPSKSSNSRLLFAPRKVVK
jgi:hypothetical protein